MVNLNKAQAVFLDEFINKIANSGSSEFSNLDYRKITKTIPMTANRQIKKLLEHGLIAKVEGKAGRSTSYEILFDDVGGVKLSA